MTSLYGKKCVVKKGKRKTTKRSKKRDITNTIQRPTYRVRGRKRSNEENTHFLAPPVQRARLTDSSLENITNMHTFSVNQPSLPQFVTPMASSSRVTLEDLPSVNTNF